MKQKNNNLSVYSLNLKKISLIFLFTIDKEEKK
jgi:hypothetical protein